MTGLGEGVRTFAARVMPASHRPLVDATVADLRVEHAAAIEAARPWLACWIAVCGYVALFKVMAISVAAAPSGEWTDCERSLLRRSLVASAAFAMLVAVLFAWRPLYEQGQRLGLGFPLVFLVPQVAPIALPVGLSLGLAATLRTRSVGWRIARPLMAVALACSVMSFGLMGWGIPVANQNFRSATRILLAPGMANEPLPRGRTELTLSELRNATIAEGDVTSMNAQYQMVMALPWAASVLAAFLLAAVRHFERRQWVFSVFAWSACPAYYYLLASGEFLFRYAGWPAVTIWLPNVVMLVTSLFFLATRPPVQVAVDRTA